MFNFQTPQKIYADALVESETKVQLQRGGRLCWVPARPEAIQSLRNRFKMAWLVFTGQADALLWRGNQGALRK